MRFSLSSIFITLVMVMIMGLLLTILLHQKKRYIFFRSDLLIILSIIILIRLLFPVELPFTRSIYIGSIMNPIQDFFDIELVKGMTVLNFFCILWIIGCIICLLMYLQRIRISKQMLLAISKTAKKRKVSSFIKSDTLSDYPVWVTNLVSVPMVLVLKEVILLPEKKFSEIELEAILQHEIQHVKNHDIYIKQFSNLLMIIYWWFLPIYWLNNNINLALEIRADAKATKHLEKADVLKYAYTLVTIEGKFDYTAIDKSLSISSNFFLQESPNVLIYRIHYLLNSDFKRKSNALILLIVILLPFISNIIILEPWYEYPHKNDGTISDTELIEEAYLYEENGTYYIIYQNEKSLVSNPDELMNMGIPLKKEK